jgi:sugar O-acyltransferase (sialic acid O-acetyltransferase NeuD family)
VSAPLLLWGASDHAGVVIDALRAGGRDDPVALLDDATPDAAAQRFGVRIVGSIAALGTGFDPHATRIHIAIGEGAARRRLALEAAALGFEFATVIHPGATIAATATIGAGSFIAAGAVVGPQARIGAHCIVNTRASVDHDCTLGDCVHVAPGAVLGGHVRVGGGAWIGLGASVRDHLTIGERALIGVGAVVVRDVAADVVAYGCPARSVRARA